MLKKCNEEDFNQIKSVALDRLSPENVSGFFWGGLVLSAVMTIISFANVGNEVSTFMAIMVSISLLLFSIQLIFTLLFTFKGVAYKLQRLQSVILSFIGFKISIDTYQAFFGVSETKNSPDFIKSAGIFLFLGGIILLVISTFRAIKRVKQGELREDGKGLYDFKNSKGFASLPFIFGVTMLGGVAGRLFTGGSSNSTVIIFLFFSVVLQYGFALALPEFFLLTYCKFRFDSFKVKRPEGRMRGLKR